VDICAGNAVKHLDIEGFSVIRSTREKETVRIFEESRDAY
jgi:hypothetical protein